MNHVQGERKGDKIQLKYFYLSMLYIGVPRIWTLYYAHVSYLCVWVCIHSCFLMALHHV